MSKILFKKKGFVIQVIDERFLRDERDFEENEILYVSRVAGQNPYVSTNEQGEIFYPRYIWDILKKSGRDYWRVRYLLTHDIREAWIFSKEGVEKYLKNVNIKCEIFFVNFEIKKFEDNKKPEVNRFQMMEINE